MRLLLDSHILLWWDHEIERLSVVQHEAIADRANEVFVSAAAAWELGIKRAKGKLEFSGSVKERLGRFGFSELSISVAHAEEVARLPLLHGDPFDRILVAQARVEGLTLVTADAAVREYTVACL